MPTESKSTFTVTSWTEETYQEHEVLKLTRAKVTQAYEGAITGESSIEYLMCSTPDGVSTTIGIELITGAVDGKSGSFAIRHTGAYANGEARSTWSVIPGSGSGELTGLRGEGAYVARHAPPAEVTFRYSFDGSA